MLSQKIKTNIINNNKPAACSSNLIKFNIEIYYILVEMTHRWIDGEEDK